MRFFACAKLVLDGAEAPHGRKSGRWRAWEDRGRALEPSRSPPARVFRYNYIILSMLILSILILTYLIFSYLLLAYLIFTCGKLIEFPTGDLRARARRYAYARPFRLTFVIR